MNNIFGMPRAQLVGVVEVIPERKDEYAAKIGCKGYLSIQDALQDHENPIDGVLVCTPTPTHYEVVKAGLLGGKHVFL